MIEFLIVLVFAVFLFILLRAITYRSKEEKEYDRKLKESLEDEFIIDPETGVKMTLEQAESGHWIKHDNEFRTVPESEIENLYTEEEKETERALNYLRGQRQYRKQELSSEQEGILQKTKILSKYDDWAYRESFSLGYCNGFLLFPQVKINANTRYEDIFVETQCMFWLNFNKDFGHYYLREKTSSEKFFDLVRNDDELNLAGYESFSFERSDNIMFLIKILETFEGHKELEIEFMGEYLFVKNIRNVNVDDIVRMENIVKELSSSLSQN